jgi:hypothetical protein
LPCFKFPMFHLKSRSAWLSKSAQSIWLLPNHIAQYFNIALDDVPGHSALRSVLSGLAATTSPAELRARSFGLKSAQTGHWIALELCYWQIEQMGARWLAHGARLSLSKEHFQKIAAALSDLLNDSSTQLVMHENGLSLWVSDQVETVGSYFPDEVSGAQMKDFLPQSKYWRRCLNEAQMQLSQLELQLERAEAGLPSINSVWFWGDSPVAANAMACARSIGIVGLQGESVLQALHDPNSAIKLRDLRFADREALQRACETMAPNDAVIFANGQCFELEKIGLLERVKHMLFSSKAGTKTMGR